MSKDKKQDDPRTFVVVCLYYASAHLADFMLGHGDCDCSECVEASRHLWAIGLLTSSIESDLPPSRAARKAEQRLLIKRVQLEGADEVIYPHEVIARMQAAPSAQ